MAEARIWDKRAIQELLRVSDKAVERAILAIYARQTEDERREGGTKQRNGVGFSGNDGKWLSLTAVDLQHGWHIPVHSMWRIRKHVMRYWRQLAEIANENEARKVASGRGQV